MTIALGGLKEPLAVSPSPASPTKEDSPASPSPAATAIVPGMFPKEGDRVTLEVFAFGQDEKVTAVKVNVREEKGEGKRKKKNRNRRI